MSFKYSYHAFSVAEPKKWNDLPSDIRIAHQWNPSNLPFTLTCLRFHITGSSYLHSCVLYLDYAVIIVIVVQ